MDSRHFLCHQQSRRSRYFHGSLPSTVVKRSKFPAFRFQTGIVTVATINIIIGIGSASCFPRSIRRKGLLRSILIIDLQFTQQTRTITPTSLMEIPYGHRLFVIPSVTQDGSHGITPFLQERSNIVRHIEISLIKMRISRIQEILSYSFPVEEHFIISCSRHIQPCLLDRLIHHKSFTEHRSRFVFLVFIVGNPLSLPVGIFPFSQLKACHIGSTTRISILIPNSNLPVITGFRFQLGPFIIYL